ncbi:hypothetical protein B0H19DRAFT_1372879 [Mycena capillaripes]|nr:hypothetical protein B0H19DRAFT_1372879 [Mycena capillaripes]
MFSRPSRRVSFAVAALLFLLTFVSYSLWPARELEPYFGPITRVNHVFQYFDEEWALSQELEKVEEQLQQKYPGLRLRFPDESYSGFPIILDVTYAVPVFEHFEDDDNGLPVPSVDAAAQAHPVPTLDTLPFASPSVDDKDLGAVSFLDVASVDHPVPQDDVFPIPPTDTLRASPAALHLLIAFACGILTSSVLAVVFLLFKRVLTSKRSSPITPFGSPVHTTDKPRRERVARSNSARAQSRPGRLRIVPIALTRIAPPSPSTVSQVTAKVPSPLPRTTKALPSPLPSSIPHQPKPAVSSSLSVAAAPKPFSAPSMSPGAHKALFNPEAPSAPGSVIYETCRSTLIYETPSAPAPSPVVYYTSGARATSQTYYVDTMHRAPARQSKIIFHGRSAPPPSVSPHVPYYAPHPYIYNTTPRAW